MNQRPPDLTATRPGAFAANDSDSDNTLGLSAMASEALAEARTSKNGRHALVGMLRQAVFGRLAGYEDVNDAERPRHDPAIRWVVGGKAASVRAASASQMGRFETRWLRPKEPVGRSLIFQDSGSTAFMPAVGPRRCPGPGFERQPNPRRTRDDAFRTVHYQCALLSSDGSCSTRSIALSRKGNVHTRYVGGVMRWGVTR